MVQPDALELLEEKWATGIIYRESQTALPFCILTIAVYWLDNRYPAITHLFKKAPNLRPSPSSSYASLDQLVLYKLFSSHSPSLSSNRARKRPASVQYTRIGSPFLPNTSLQLPYAPSSAQRTTLSSPYNHEGFSSRTGPAYSTSLSVPLLPSMMYTNIKLKNFNDREERFRLAIEEASSNKTITLSTIANKYRISRTTLSRRLSGCKNARFSHEKQQKFTNDEELSIVQTIKSMIRDNNEVPQKKDIITFCEKLLKKKQERRGIEVRPGQCKVRKNWMDRFLERHSSDLMVGNVTLVEFYKNEFFGRHRLKEHRNYKHSVEPIIPSIVSSRIQTPPAMVYENFEYTYRDQQPVQDPIMSNTGHQGQMQLKRPMSASFSHFIAQQSCQAVQAPIQMVPGDWNHQPPQQQHPQNLQYIHHPQPQQPLQMHQAHIQQIQQMQQLQHMRTKQQPFSPHLPAIQYSQQAFPMSQGFNYLPHVSPSGQQTETTPSARDVPSTSYPNASSNVPLEEAYPSIPARQPNGSGTNSLTFNSSGVYINPNTTDSTSLPPPTESASFEARPSEIHISQDRNTMDVTEMDLMQFFHNGIFQYDHAREFLEKQLQSGIIDSEKISKLMGFAIDQVRRNIYPYSSSIHGHESVPEEFTPRFEGQADGHY